MLPYIILISAVFVLSLLCFNKYNKNISLKALKIIFLTACFFILYIFSVLRSGIGNDYNMYYNGFYLMGMDSFSNISYLDWEWGFTILTKIICFFTTNIHIYMAVIAAICLAGPFYLIYRYSKKVWLSVVLYINLYFFYCTMNFLRQCIAISIFMFAYTFLIDRKFWRYAMLILIAAAFHTTVLIMIPAYFLINFKPSLKVPILYAYAILWVFISSNGTLDLLTHYIHAEYRQSVFLTRGLDLINTAIPTLILFAGIFLTVKFIKRQEIKDSEITVVRMTNLMYFSYFWILIMLRHAIFERFSYYTYFLVILYIPELLAFADEKYKEYVNRQYNAALRTKKLSANQQKAHIAYYKRNKKILFFFVTASVIVITLSFNIYGLLAYYHGVHGVYPYTSWLT